MELKDMIAKALKELAESNFEPEETTKEPLCLFKDHPDLQEKHKAYVAQAEAIADEALAYKAKHDELKKPFDDLREAYFKELETAIVERGLATREDVDRAENVCTGNGVIALEFSKSKD